MEKIKKYILVVFLLANLTAEHWVLHPVSNVLFYSSLAIGLIIALPSSLTRKNFRIFKPLYLIGLLYIVYQFTIGWDTINQKNLIYVLAKVTTFMIMAASISTNFEFYFRKMLKPLAIVITILVVYGLVFNRVTTGGRATLQFYNPNAACLIASTGFAAWLFSTKKIRLQNGAAMLICLLGVLSGGSRLSLGMCFVFVLMRYGFSRKLIWGMSAFMIILILLPEIGVNLPGFGRVLGTFTGEVDFDRENEREAAEWMIAQKPWTGWGFDVVNEGEAAELSEYGAHNGYLEMIKFIGYPLAIIWMCLLLFPTYKTLGLYKKADNFIKFHIAVMISVIVGAMYEGFFTGVNQIVTNLFFTSFAVMLYYRNQYVKYHLSKA